MLREREGKREKRNQLDFLLLLLLQLNITHLFALILSFSLSLTRANQLPGRPFRNFEGSKSVARRSRTTWNSLLSGWKLWKGRSGDTTSSLSAILQFKAEVKVCEWLLRMCGCACVCTSAAVAIAVEIQRMNLAGLGRAYTKLKRCTFSAPILFGMKYIFQNRRLWSLTKKWKIIAERYIFKEIGKIIHAGKCESDQRGKVFSR